MPFWEEDDREKSEDSYEQDLSRHQHSISTQRTFQVLRKFVKEFSERSEATNFASVIEGELVLASEETPNSVAIDQKPERFIEDYLVEPLLESLGHEVRFRPNNYPMWTESTPDFAIKNFDAGLTGDGTKMREGCRVIGEVKPPNNIDEAREEAKMYLDEDAGVHAVAVATDGLRWTVWLQPRTESKERLLDIDLTNPANHLCRRYKEKHEIDYNYVRDSIESEDVVRLSKTGLEKRVIDII